MNGDIILEEKEKEPNIYIKAMELGYRANDGISYLNMKELLENVFDIKFSNAREYTFLLWFFENFSNEHNLVDIKRLIYLYIYRRRTYRENPLLKNLENKFFINGYTVKQYIDYLELTEARVQAGKAQESAQKALKKAKQSIWIAAGGLLISVIISLYIHLTTPMPPFEVKIVEDHTIPNIPEVIEIIPETIPVNDSIKVDTLIQNQ